MNAYRDVQGIHATPGSNPDVQENETVGHFHTLFGRHCFGSRERKPIPQTTTDPALKRGDIESVAWIICRVAIDRGLARYIHDRYTAVELTDPRTAVNGENTVIASGGNTALNTIKQRGLPYTL